MRMIDFEYGGPNYLAYDIANHFCEFAGTNYVHCQECIKESMQLHAVVWQLHFDWMMSQTRESPHYTSFFHLVTSHVIFPTVFTTGICAVWFSSSLCNSALASSVLYMHKHVYGNFPLWRFQQHHCDTWKVQKAHLPQTWGKPSHCLVRHTYIHIDTCAKGRVTYIGAWSWELGMCSLLYKLYKH